MRSNVDPQEDTIMNVLLLVVVVLFSVGIGIMLAGGHLMKKRNGLYNCHNTTDEKLMDTGACIALGACALLAIGGVLLAIAG